LDVDDDVVNQHSGRKILVLSRNISILSFTLDRSLKCLELDGLQVSEATVLATTTEGETHATTSSGRSGMLVEVVEQVVRFQIMNRHMVTVNENVGRETFIGKEATESRSSRVIIVTVMMIVIILTSLLSLGGIIITIIIIVTANESIHASCLQVSEGAIFAHWAGRELGT
jgi:hypothetical protein